MGHWQRGARLGGGRYPELPAEQLDALAGTPILLASEPYPFASKHLRAIRFVGLRPMLVDGEAFSWYGSRMLHTVDYLNYAPNLGSTATLVRFQGRFVRFIARSDRHVSLQRLESQSARSLTIPNQILEFNTSYE